MPKPPVPEQKSLVGYTVGRCKLLRICGRGAMGTVYKGLHSGLDIEVAVKILPPHLAVNSNLIERFLREAKLAARLNHINTVRVYDVGEESGYYYLVMEFVDGTDALELVKNHGRQPAWVAADIGSGAARALEHAHKNDVIHRDIKPANLMLPNTGGVKVADFGLARALASDSGLTMTGAIMGTPDYMAPEQAQGASVGPLADVYSLGATLFHIFVGRPPFAGASPMAVALQHVTSRIVVPEEMVKSEGDKHLVRMIHELTSKDPEKRSGDLAKIADRLKDIARGRSTTQKLLSEGATLYATAGVKVDVDAINKAKEEAAAAALNKGAPESPHIDKLRKAAEKVRSGMYPAVPDTPSKPKAVPTEMAELTGDMVREARGRARRSSGQIPALPRETGKPPEKQRTSNPAMSPHRDQRPSSGSSRRSAIVQNPELESDDWQSYAAKSFPTFERDSIIDGSASSRITRESSIMEAPGSGIHPPAPPPEPDYGTYSSYTPRKRSNTKPLVLLLLLLVFAGGGYAVWFYVLKDDASPTDHGQTQVVRQATAQRIDAFTRAGVTSLTTRRGVHYAGSDSGIVARFEDNAAEPTHFLPIERGAITALALRPDGSRLVIGTAEGEVAEVSGADLEFITRRVALLEGLSITALLVPAPGLTVIGASDGTIRATSSDEAIQVADGAPVSQLLWRANEIWATAGKTLARYRLARSGLELISSVPLSHSIKTWADTPNAVFAITEAGLVRMTPEGPVGDAVEVERPFVAATRDGSSLVVMRDGKLAVLNAANFEQQAELDLRQGELPNIAVPGTRDRETVIGTSDGVLLVVRTS